MRRECDGKETPGVEDGKEKSERKRQREKQRRSELTNAFDDLSAMVLKMDTADEEDGPDCEGGRKKNRRMSARSDHENDNSGGMTRVDLINRALAIMKRLSQENQDLKQSLARAGGREKSNEVMVMVPTLTPADDASAPPPAASVASFRPPYMFPPLGQQDHPQPMYGAQSCYPPPPQQGAWGPPFPGPPSYGGPGDARR